MPMPLQPSPYDALKKLLGSSPDLNAGDPKGMVANRLKQEDVAKEMLHTAQSARQTGGVTGATPSDYADLAKTLGESPNFGIGAEQRASDINAANDRAMQAGFTGDSEIAGPASGGGPQGERLYANVGYRSNDNPAQMAGKSASAVEAMKTQMPLLAAREKGMGDILAEREKGNQTRQTGEAEFNRTAGFLRGGQVPGQPGQPNQPGGANAVDYGSTTAAPQSQSWSQYMFGGGPRPHNDFMSALGAMSERAKYGGLVGNLGAQSTPFAPLIQNESFGNLEQLQAQFPGVRGFSYLLPKLAEHQANFGKGETPDSTYLRLHGMEKILHNLETEVNDPSTHARMGAHGQLEMTATPAVIQSKIAAIHDTLQRVSEAKRQIKQQYPTLAEPNENGQQAPGPVAAPGASRFEKIGG